MRNLKEQVKNHSVTKNSSDLSLFESIVLVISKNLKTLGLQPRISKSFSRSLELFFSQKVRTILVTKYQKKFICQKVSSKEKF